MKNVNKYKKKTKMKNVMALVGMVLAFAGSVFAGSESSTQQASNSEVTLTVQNVDEWLGLQSKIDLLASSVTDLVIVVDGNIEFSSLSGMPRSNAVATVASSIDLYEKNLKLVGVSNSKSHSISGAYLKNKGSLFKNVKTLTVENLDFNYCYLLAVTGVDSNYVGFLAKSAENVYLKSVNLKDVGAKGVPSDNKIQVYKDVGFLVGRVDNDASVSSIFVDGLVLDSMYSPNMGGLFGKVKSNFSVKNGQLAGIAVNRLIPNTEGSSISLGGLVGSQEGSGSFSATNSSINMDLSVNGDYYQGVLYAGGLVGLSDSKKIEMDGISISGDIKWVNTNHDDASNLGNSKFRIGGAIGEWNGTTSAIESKFGLVVDNSVSQVNISADLWHYMQKFTFSPGPIAEIPNCSMVGGFVGNAILGKENNSVFKNSEFSGSITYLAENIGYPSIGGFVGLYDNSDVNSSSLEFANNKVNGNALTYEGISYASIGNLLGSAKGTSINADDIEINKDIKAELFTLYEDEPIDGASIGGAFGALINSPTELKNVSVKSNIKVKDDMKNAEATGNTPLDFAMGGVIGYVEQSSLIFSADYQGTLSSDRNNAGSTTLKSSEQYIGGLVGEIVGVKVGSQPDVVLTNSSAVGEKGKLIAVNFGGDKEFNSVMMGGFIGGTKNNIKSLKVESTFATGAMDANVFSKYIYIAGMFGYINHVADMDVLTSFFNGSMSVNKVNSSAIMYATGLANFNYVSKLIASNSYVYESNNLAASVFSSSTIGSSDTPNFYVFTSLDDSHSWMNDILPATPEFAYHLNEGLEKPVWYYDMNSNNGLPQLSLAASDPKPIQKVTLVGFDESGSTPADVDVYTNYNGAWELKSDGRKFSDDELDVSVYDANAKKFVLWKQKDGDLEWKGLAQTESSLADGMVFEKQVVDAPKVVFDVDTTLETGNRVLFWDNSEYNLVGDDSLPEAVFVVLNNNGNGTFYRGAFWKIAGMSDVVTSSAELINYVVHNPTSEIKLEFATDLLYDYVVAQPRGKTLNDREKALVEMLNQKEIETTSLMLSNSSGIKIRYTCMGHERVVLFKGNDRLLPKVDKFSIVDVLDADSSKISFVVSKTGGVVVRTDYLFGEELELSSILASGEELMIYQTERTIRIPTGPDSTIVVDSTGKPSIVTVDSTGKQIIVPIDSTDPSDPVDPPVVDNIGGCADSVTISDAYVLKSGTAALLSFKLDAPSICDTLLNPRVVVSGADGVVLDSAFKFSRKAREFVLYPLNPGEYSFTIKASSTTSETIKQEFSANVEIRGRVWNMVAYGSWPKNALKNAKPTIYSWNESNAIGDYWQYEALPKNAKVDETAGYWVRTESNVEFSLDLPLKKAESDSLSWTVEKKFSGWNMLANPYSWNLYAGSIAGFKSAENGDAPIWRWNTVTAKYDVADTLFANEAFWVNVDKKRTLRISTKPVFPAVEVKSAAKNPSPLYKSASKDSWSMLLVASTEDGVADSWNVLGVGSKNIAIAEPPAGMENAVGVSFVGEDNAMLAKRILAKASGDEYTWKVQLNASKSGKLNLALEGLDEVRAMGYEVSLVMDGKTYEWNDNSSMDVNVSGSKTAELKVVPAGTKIAAAKGIGNVHYDVVAGGIAVQFDVSAGMAGQKAAVRLLDVNGNVVSTALGNARSGTNDFRLATPARSGVYVLQVRVGRESRVARLSL